MPFGCVGIVDVEQKGTYYWNEDSDSTKIVVETKDMRLFYFKFLNVNDRREAQDLIVRRAFYRKMKFQAEEYVFAFYYANETSEGEFDDSLGKYDVFREFERMNPPVFFYLLV